MTKTFIQTNQFSREWDRLGLNDNDLRRLEYILLKNPKTGNVIPGTGKLRKMRFSYMHGGKSGGVRVCYVDYVIYDTIYLVTLYPKNEKENLTMKERSDIKRAIEMFEKYLGEVSHE